MKVLVMGSNGMAGHMVTSYLSDKYEVTTLARNNADINIDVCDFSSLKNILTNYSFDFIINCIGMLVLESARNPDLANRVNGHFPKYLEKLYENTETKIIHISTDCVFSGDLGSYTEYSEPDATTVYGRSKAIGEINNTKDITLRTSIIGPEISDHRTGLFEWFINSESSVSGWTNAMWNGITTLQLAKVIETVIENPSVCGLHHPTTEEHISKKDLLELINLEYALEKQVLEQEAPYDVDKTLINSKQFFSIPTYEQQLKELREYGNLLR